jgi:proton glutamate symport protein
MAFLNDTGALVGADVELALLFAEQMNLKAGFLPLGIGGSGGGSGEQALRNGRCDMTIALKAAAPDQASALRFSTVQEVYGVSLLLHGERLRSTRCPTPASTPSNHCATLCAPCRAAAWMRC